MAGKTSQASQVYNDLLAGDVIELAFPDEANAKVYANIVRVYHSRRKEEMAAMGFPSHLSIITKGNDSDGNIIAEYKLTYEPSQHQSARILSSRTITSEDI